MCAHVYTCTCGGQTLMLVSSSAVFHLRFWDTAIESGTHWFVEVGRHQAPAIYLLCSHRTGVYTGLLCRTRRSKLRFSCLWIRHFTHWAVSPAPLEKRKNRFTALWNSLSLKMHFVMLMVLTVPSSSFHPFPSPNPTQVCSYAVVFPSLLPMGTGGECSQETAILGRSKITT